MKNRRILNIAIVILLVAALCFSTVAFAEDSSHEKVDNAKTAVVRIVSEFDYGDYSMIQSGTAFGVGEQLDSEPEYFVTNAHVIKDEYGNFADTVYLLLESNAVKIDKVYAELQLDKNTTIKGWFTENYEINPAKVLECMIISKKDVSLYPDVAVLKSEKPVPGRTCLALYDTSEDVTGAQSVYAIGYPGSADDLQTVIKGDKKQESYSGDVKDVIITDGVISSKTNSKALENTDVILHTASVTPGNSGGPLVDENGNVVGINTYSSEVDASKNVSIYIDYAITFLDNASVPYLKTSEIKDEGFFTTKNIILCALIAAIIAAAAILILHFKKKSKEYVDPADMLPRIQGLSGYFEGRRFPIDNQVIIGRAPSCNIVFPTDTQGVSSKHCVITNNNGQLYIKDLESSYGTFLNGKTKLEPNKFVTINIGDRIALGSENQSFIITRKGGVL